MEVKMMRYGEEQGECSKFIFTILNERNFLCHFQVPYVIERKYKLKNGLKKYKIRRIGFRYY